MIWSLATFTPPDYAGVEYPGWANAIGWLTIVTGLIFIPIMAIVAVVKNNGDFFQVLIIKLLLSYFFVIKTFQLGDTRTSGMK